jgi:ribosomal protein S27AE
MAGIAEMTRHIVERAKKYEHDTIPGDFGKLNVPCPKCGGEIHEQYKHFQCVKCDFSVWKTLCSRMFEPEEVEKLITEKQVGPLQGFMSKKGFPFAALLKMNAEHKLEFDFGNEQGKDGEAAAPMDFTGKEPLGKCPACGANVFDGGMNYVCENQAGVAKSCKFRTGKIILQQEISTEQVKKLLATGKTDLLKGFISNKTKRKFEAFLVLKDGKTAFEFAPREKKSKSSAPREPLPKIDFTGLTPLAGKCPKCGGKIFEGPAGFICENSQRDGKACKFNIGKVILEQPVEREQVQKLLAGEKTDLLSKFVSSKTGKPFAAFLVMDAKGKVTFDFPPREGE